MAYYQAGDVTLVDRLQLIKEDIVSRTYMTKPMIGKVMLGQVLT